MSWTSRKEALKQGFINEMTNPWTIGSTWELYISSPVTSRRQSMSFRGSITLIESITTSDQPSHLLIYTSTPNKYAVVASNFQQPHIPPGNLGDLQRLTQFHTMFYEHLLASYTHWFNEHRSKRKEDNQDDLNLLHDKTLVLPDATDVEKHRRDLRKATLAAKAITAATHESDEEAGSDAETEADARRKAAEERELKTPSRMNVLSPNIYTVGDNGSAAAITTTTSAASLSASAIDDDDIARAITFDTPQRGQATSTSSDVMHVDVSEDVTSTQQQTQVSTSRLSIDVEATEQHDATEDYNPPRRALSALSSLSAMEVSSEYSVPQRSASTSALATLSQAASTLTAAALAQHDTATATASQQDTSKTATSTPKSKRGRSASTSTSTSTSSEKKARTASASRKKKVDTEELLASAEKTSTSQIAPTKVAPNEIKELNDKIAHREIGRNAQVPITSIKDLPSMLQSRPYDEEHAKRLMREMSRSGRYDPAYPIKLVLIGGGNPKQPFTLHTPSGIAPQWHNIFSNGTLYPAAGMHRLNALRMLVKAYKENPTWGYVPAIVFHFPEGLTPETEELIMWIGGQDNRTASIQRPVTFAQRIDIMHRRYVDLFGLEGARAHASMGKKHEELKRYKETWSKMWGLNIANEATVAGWPDVPFQLLMRYLTRTNVKDTSGAAVKSKPPESVKHFLPLHPLHNDDKIRLLTSLVEGEITLDTFDRQVVQTRNILVIRDAIMVELGCTTWEEAEQKYPRVMAVNWLSDWVKAITAAAGGKLLHSRAPNKWVPTGPLLKQLQDMKNKVVPQSPSTESKVHEIQEGGHEYRFLCADSTEFVSSLSKAGKINAGTIIIDIPTGRFKDKGMKFDEKWTVDQVKEVIGQVDAIIHKEAAPTIVMYASLSLAISLEPMLADTRWSDTKILYWFPTSLPKSGPKAPLGYDTEIILLAMSRTARSTHPDIDTLLTINNFQWDRVTHPFTVPGSAAPVNLAEKPWEMELERFIKPMCHPTETVISINGGSGSTILAALRHGVSALYIDKDPDQLAAAIVRFNAFIEQTHQQQKQKEEKEKQEKDEKEKQQQPVTVTCAACSKPVLPTQKSATCAGESCGSVQHVTCMTPSPTTSTDFLCKVCAIPPAV